jgi:hypothetical protein
VKNNDVIISHNESDFDWEETVSNTLDIVRWSIMRKDYKDAAKHCLVLGFLGIELEELGLTDSELNQIAMNL